MCEAVIRQENELAAGCVMALIGFWFGVAIFALIDKRKLANSPVFMLTKPTLPRRVCRDVSQAVRATNALGPFLQNVKENVVKDANQSAGRQPPGGKLREDENRRDEYNGDNAAVDERPQLEVQFGIENVHSVRRFSAVYATTSRCAPRRVSVSWRISGATGA